MVKFKNVHVGQDEQPGNDQRVSGNEQQTGQPENFEPTAKKKVRSEKQQEASRRNGSHGRGPNDTARTRYNAIRHGLRAQGLTPGDDAAEYLRVLSDLENKYSSSDPFDIVSIRESALEIVRMRRINRLEADTIIGLTSFSESSSQPTSDDIPTIHFAAMKEYGGPVFDLLNRYKTGGMNRLLRWRRELERVPRNEASQTANSDSDDDGIVI
jgi:hypothetical protein